MASLEFNPSNPLQLLGFMAGELRAPIPALAMFEFLVHPDFASISKADQRYLAGPLIIGTAPGGSWTNTMPSWIARQAREERYRLVLGQMPGHLITPTEILAALYEPSLVAPMQEFPSELYLWAGCQATARQFKRDLTEVRAQMECRSTDRDFLEANGRHHYAYREFALDLRRKVEAGAPKAATA